MKGFRVLNIFSIIASLMMMIIVAVCYEQLITLIGPHIDSEIIRSNAFIYQNVPLIIFFLVAICLLTSFVLYGMRKERENSISKPSIFWNLIAYIALLIQIIIIFAYFRNFDESFLSIFIFAIPSAVIYFINIIYSLVLIIIKRVSIAPFPCDSKSEMSHAAKIGLKNIATLFATTCFYFFAILFLLGLVFIKMTRMMWYQGEYEISYSFKRVVYFISLVLGVIFFATSIMAFVLFLKGKDRTKKGVVLNVITGVGLFLLASMFSFASLRDHDTTLLISNDGSIISPCYGVDLFVYGDYNNIFFIGYPDQYFVLFSTLLLSLAGIYSINSAPRTQFLDKRVAPIVASSMVLFVSLVSCVLAMVGSYKTSGIHPPMVNVSASLFVISLIVLITCLKKECDRNFLTTSLASGISVASINLIYFIMAIGYVNYAIPKQASFDGLWLVETGEPNQFSNMDELHRVFNMYLISTIFLALLLAALVALLIIFLKKNKKIENNPVLN